MARGSTRVSSFPTGVSPAKIPAPPARAIVGLSSEDALVSKIRGIVRQDLGATGCRVSGWTVRVTRAGSGKRFAVCDPAEKPAEEIGAGHDAPVRPPQEHDVAIDQVAGGCAGIGVESLQGRLHRRFRVADQNGPVTEAPRFRGGAVEQSAAEESVRLEHPLGLALGPDQDNPLLARRVDRAKKGVLGIRAHSRWTSPKTVDALEASIEPARGAP